MSDFLLIVPEGWVEFPETNALLNDGATPPDMAYFWIAQEAWGDIDTFLASAGMGVPGKLVCGAKLFSESDGYHLWMTFA
jgi:hypothetical protein